MRSGCVQIECARSLALLQEHEPGKLGMTPSRDNCEVHARPHNEVKTARKDKKMVESHIPELRATGKNQTRLAIFLPSSMRAAIEEVYGGML